jgi:uncharacterized RDD family membrane protein YckC
MSTPPPPPPPPPPPLTGTYRTDLPGPLADWPQRALGGLIDYGIPFVITFLINVAVDSAGLAVVVALAGAAWGIYNGYLNGSTGQSVGKRTVGLKVVGERTGQVIGGGLGIVRSIVHVVDSLICYIGWLFPLWDAKKQTLADKIMKTVVITVPK